MNKEIKTYFIRHNIDTWKDPGTWKIKDNATTLNILNEAWDKGLAIIDYEEIDNINYAFNPEFYSSAAAKNTIKKVNELLKTGGILAILSLRNHRGKLLVGEIPPYSHGELYKFDAFPSYYFKVIRLNQPKIATLDKYPSLFSKIPRQTAFTHWPLANKTLVQFYEGKTPSIDDITDFDTNQLEVLCYEWLKENDRIKHLTLPIGRTMIDVDIVGIDKFYQKVFAQVTFYPKEKKDKLESLEHIASEYIRYYFCKCETQIEEEGKVRFISIDDVFQYFYQSNQKKQFLKYLIGI